MTSNVASFIAWRKHQNSNKNKRTKNKTQLKEYFKVKSWKILHCKKNDLKKSYCFINSCLAYIAQDLLLHHAVQFQGIHSVIALTRKKMKLPPKKGSLGSSVAITFSAEANSFCICAYQVEILVFLPESPLLSLGRRQITVSPVPITSH